MPTSIHLADNFRAFVCRWREVLALFYKAGHEIVSNLINVTPKEIGLVSSEMLAELFLHSESDFCDDLVLLIKQIGYNKHKIYMYRKSRTFYLPLAILPLAFWQVLTR